MIEDLRQEELDLFEQQILTDVFGGAGSEHMTIGNGIFKFDISDEVQKYIDKFENMARPLMDDQGKIDGSKIKKYLSGRWADVIPDEKFRLIEIYRHVSPLIKNILGVKQ